MVAVSVPAVVVKWLSCVVHKKLFDIERDYRQYRGGSVGDKGRPARVLVDFIDVFDDVFVKEVLLEGDGGYSFPADDLPAIASATAVLPRQLQPRVPSFSTLYGFR